MQSQSNMSLCLDFTALIIGWDVCLTAEVFSSLWITLGNKIFQDQGIDVSVVVILNQSLSKQDVWSTGDAGHEYLDWLWIRFEDV